MSVYRKVFLGAALVVAVVAALFALLAFQGRLFPIHYAKRN
jgi:hypothetical protein